VRVEKHKNEQESSDEEVTCQVRVFFRGLASLCGETITAIPVPRSVVQDRDALYDYLRNYVIDNAIDSECGIQLSEVIEWDLEEIYVEKIGDEDQDALGTPVGGEDEDI